MGYVNPTLNNVLVNLMLTAEQNLAGAKGKQLESWVADQLERQVETNDNLIPLLKEYVDLPWVDELEAKAVKAGVKAGRELLIFAVRKAYTFAVAKGIIKEKEDSSAPPIAPLDERDGDVADQLGVQLSGLAPTDAPVDNSKHEVVGQDQFGNKQNIHGEIIQPNATPEPTPLPNAAAQSPAPTPDTQADASSDEDKALQAYLVQSEHFVGGGWYEFPVEGEAPKRVQGKDKALEYFKTRPDLLEKYEQSKQATQN